MILKPELIVKDLKRLLILSIMFLLGLGYAAYYYNAPINGKELTVLITHGCSRNDGLKWIRRSYFDPTKFTYQCNDTALFKNNYVELKK